MRKNGYFWLQVVEKGINLTISAVHSLKLPFHLRCWARYAKLYSSQRHAHHEYDPGIECKNINQYISKINKKTFQTLQQKHFALNSRMNYFCFCFFFHSCIQKLVQIKMKKELKSNYRSDQFDSLLYKFIMQLMRVPSSSFFFQSKVVPPGGIDVDDRELSGVLSRDVIHIPFFWLD